MSAARPPQTGRRVDLHAHTHFSDGLLSPAALVELALERGLVALAVTDHDAVDGIVPARAAAGDRLQVLAGIEISSTLEGLDLHMLGYFVDETSPALNEKLASFREERRARAVAILERLAQLGAAVDPEEVFTAAGPGVVGRPHVAQALVRAGHVPSMDVAFQRYLGPRGDAYVPRPVFRSEDAIAVIREAGGAAVLAHPGSLSRLLVERLANAGMAGVEVWHPQHGVIAQRRWTEVARDLSLVPSGGSDFHGPQRGAQLGDMAVPEVTIQLLRERAGR